MKNSPQIGRAMGLAFAAFVLFMSCVQAGARQKKGAAPASRKPHVLILGTYHMGNPGKDVLNVKADDVLAPRRQREIAAVVALLRRFRPTKIAIESTPGNTKYAERYERYVRGEYEPARDEVEQIAFRLAKGSGHAQLYPVDWKNDFDFGSVKGFAEANGQAGLIEAAMLTARAQVAETDRLMRGGTVRQVLRAINSERNIRESHRPYLTLARVGEGERYAGADLAAGWYERNLKIFVNITRITDSPDDRVLVIFGSGHAPLLRHFVEESGDYVLEKVDRYL